MMTGGTPILGNPHIPWVNDDHSQTWIDSRPFLGELPLHSPCFKPGVPMGRYHSSRHNGGLMGNSFSNRGWSFAMFDYVATTRTTRTPTCLALKQLAGSGWCLHMISPHLPHDPTNVGMRESTKTHVNQAMPKTIWKFPKNQNGLFRAWLSAHGDNPKYI